ncbi:hypothetical protein QFC19_008851 [Naganishia cerealis]|uniref:Uncharacterized protein n=1 Tax=Naganishia cerealis TaxID=610337 RepID=A0ACC2UYM2_9TREE|nr:hypothetical protein QFC19_008851 [Naganishia cerealis]
MALPFLSARAGLMADSVARLKLPPREPARRREVWEAEEPTQEGGRSDGYEVVQLGLQAREDWENDAEEYLDDEDDDESTHQRRPFSRFISRGSNATRTSTARTNAEDDIVDSYLHRTPFLEAEESRDSPFSPSSGFSETGLMTSPTSGPDSSPSSSGGRAGTTAATTGTSTGRKWMAGLGIGLGVPLQGAGADKQNQIRRRTPRSVIMGGGTAGSVDSQEHGEGDQHGRDQVDRQQRSSRPTLSRRSSTTASSTGTKRRWSWLNGLGIAHMFTGTAQQGDEKREEDAWNQQRVPSHNIWGAAARPLERETQRNSDGLQNPQRWSQPESHSAQDSQRSRGTIRLIQPPNRTSGEAREDSDEEDGPRLPHDRHSHESESQNPPANAESAPPPYHHTDGSAHRERTDSFNSYHSRTSSNERRDSTGFRHAVLAALGFSSGHARSAGGLTSRLPSTGHIPDLGHSDLTSSPEYSRAGVQQSQDLSRNDSSGLFSLPPAPNTAASGPSQSVGLGIAYGRTRSASQFSYPSHAGTWDALYPDHNMDLDLDSDMLDFSSPSGISNSRSGSASVFPSSHTSASATRSPALMSTGPMPQSEQFYADEDPVPPLPSSGASGGNGWNAEEERDIALALTVFDADQPTNQETAQELPQQADSTVTTRAGVEPEVSSISTKRFPFPPQRQLATSPRGLRPRPSQIMLRQHPGTSSLPINEESGSKEPESKQLGHMPRKPSLPVTTPTRPGIDNGTSILSPTSVYSTNTFGGHGVAPHSRSLDNPLSPPISAALDGSTENWSRARFSHLFAGKSSRLSGISTSEPISGNSFSSLQQQQGAACDHSGNNSNRTSAPDEARVLQTSSSRHSLADQTSENRWSTVSFPGHPIVSPELFQHAAMGLHSDAHATSPQPSRSVEEASKTKRRPLPLIKPIATRSPMEVQHERTFSQEGEQSTSGTAPLESADMAMGDASAAAQVGSFFTSQSSSGSSKSNAELGTSPRESPTGVNDPETTIVYPDVAAMERQSRWSVPQDRISDLGAGAAQGYADGRMARVGGRRTKMSGSTSSSSVVATSNLQSLPENVEEIENPEADTSERGREEMQALPRTVSMAAMHGRRSIPQLVTPEQVFSAHFNEMQDVVSKSASDAN